MTDDFKLQALAHQAELLNRLRAAMEDATTEEMIHWPRFLTTLAVAAAAKANGEDLRKFADYEAEEAMLRQESLMRDLHYAIGTAGTAECWEWCRVLQWMVDDVNQQLRKGLAH